MAGAIFVASWEDGVTIFDDGQRRHELAGEAVRGLCRDAGGGVLAVVGGHSLRRRAGDAAWTTIATSDLELSTAAAVGEAVYIGTDDGARMMRRDGDGKIKALTGFDAVDGRSSWYAGAALVDGELMGPPLGVRSIVATADGATILANVHVGGIPRSLDGGATWQPTIDVDADVHQLAAHPEDPDVVIAAAAVGLCVSRDAGATWSIERQGLHASYCSAVAFCGGDLFVTASRDHFSPDGAVYRRPVAGEGPLTQVEGGLPSRLDGIVDTDCLAAAGSMLAVVDQAGTLYASTDGGARWTRLAGGLPSPSGVLIV